MPPARQPWLGIGRPLALSVSFVLLLVACGEGEEPVAPDATSEAVSFRSSDGVRLEGRLFGDGAIGIVLSHMRPADQSSWWDFAGELADAGYLALTFDFRGYCPGGAAGCSEGDRNTEAIWQDVVGAIDFVHSRGAGRVMLIGASMGGTASLIAASQDGVEAEVVITLSAPISFEGLEASPEVLTRIRAAKLFIAGVDDGSAAGSAQMLYDRSPLPKRLEILTTGDHGTDILEGNQAGPVRTLILNYLAQYSDA
jgi:pimeloyl-ACP methyl ester carboxylesterase